MADDVTVEIKGLEELQKALEELPRKVATKGMRAALKDGAEPIREAMVANAPKHTGFLSEHFGTKISIRRDELAGSAFIGPQGKVDYPLDENGTYRIVKDESGKIIAKVGKKAVATVARFLEFGTSKMAAHPFMTISFESMKSVALDRIIARLRDVIFG